MKSVIIYLYLSDKSTTDTIASANNETNKPNQIESAASLKPTSINEKPTTN
jgi:hypothetical protein